MWWIVTSWPLLKGGNSPFRPKGPQWRLTRDPVTSLLQPAPAPLPHGDAGVARLFCSFRWRIQLRDTRVKHPFRGTTIKAKGWFNKSVGTNNYHWHWSVTGSWELDTGGIKLAICVLPNNLPYCVNRAYSLAAQQNQQQSRARNLWDIKFYRLHVECGWQLFFILPGVSLISRDGCVLKCWDILLTKLGYHHRTEAIFFSFIIATFLNLNCVWPQQHCPQYVSQTPTNTSHERLKNDA